MPVPYYKLRESTQSHRICALVGSDPISNSLSHLGTCWAIDWFANDVSIIKSIELVLPLDTQKLVGSFHRILPRGTTRAYK